MVKKDIRNYQRQAMSVCPAELRALADDLEQQYTEMCKELNIEFNNEIISRKFSVSIINKSKCSDTWEFEHIKNKVGK